MKIKSILAAVALAAFAVGASGCASLGRVIGNEQAATYDEKALITVELAYGFVLSSVLTANAAGAIDEDEAARIIPVLDRAQAAVVRARALYDAGQALDSSIETRNAVEQVAALTTLLIELGVVSRNGG